MLLIVPSRYFCGGSFRFMSWCLKFFVLLVTEWPPIGKIAAHSAYDMFHGIMDNSDLGLFGLSQFGP